MAKPQPACPGSKWGRQSCLRGALWARFPARPSRLKSRLAAKINCPTIWHSYFMTGGFIIPE